MGIAMLLLPTGGRVSRGHILALPAGSSPNVPWPPPQKKHTADTRAVGMWACRSNFEDCGRSRERRKHPYDGCRQSSRYCLALRHDIMVRIRVPIEANGH